METKKSILKHVKPTGRQDAYGNWSYSVTFENGDSGLLTAKTDAIGSIGFIVGNEVDYNIERKISEKSGNEWFKITRLSREQKGLQPNTSFNSQPNTQRGEDVQSQIIRQSSVKAAIDYMVGSGQNLSLDKMLYTAEVIFNFCKTGEINGQTPVQSKVSHKLPFSVPNESDLPF